MVGILSFLSSPQAHHHSRWVWWLVSMTSLLCTDMAGNIWFLKSNPQKESQLTHNGSLFLAEQSQISRVCSSTRVFSKMQEALTPSTWSLWLPCCSLSTYNELRGEHAGRYYIQSTFITLPRTWSHGASVSYCCCNKLEKLKEYTFVLFKVWRSEVWNQSPSLKLRC